MLRLHVRKHEQQVEAGCTFVAPIFEQRVLDAKDPEGTVDGQMEEGGAHVKVVSKCADIGNRCRGWSLVVHEVENQIMGMQ